MSPTISSPAQVNQPQFPLPCIRGRSGMCLKDPQKTGELGKKVLLGPAEKTDPALSKSTSYTRS